MFQIQNVFCEHNVSFINKLTNWMLASLSIKNKKLNQPTKKKNYFVGITYLW